MEPILIQSKRFNFLPQRFLHRGVEQRVWRVERTWDVSARRGQRAGHYFRVRCQDDALYDLFHDVTLNAWYIKRPRQLFWPVRHSITLGRGKLKWSSI